MKQTPDTILPEKPKKSHETSVPKEPVGPLENVFSRLYGIGWQRELTNLKEDTCRLLESSANRLTSALDDGILTGFESSSTLVKLAELDENIYAKLQNFVRRYPGTSPGMFITSPEMLAPFDESDPRSVFAGILLKELGSIGCAYALNDKKITSKLLGQTDPTAWLDHRLEIGRRAKNLSRNRKLDSQMVFGTDEEKLIFLEGLEDDGLRKLFGKLILERASFGTPEDAAAFIRRVGLWKEICDNELENHLLSEEKSFNRDKEGLFQLFRTRGSWIAALAEQAGTGELRELLRNPLAVNSLVRAAEASRIFAEIRLKEETAWAEREELPIESTDPKLAAEVRDILDASGLETITKRCVQAVEIEPEIDNPNVTGDYMRLSNNITLYPQNRKEKDTLPGTLMHETGHAFNLLIGQKNAGQSNFDRYAVKLIYSGGLGPSAYAEAYAQIRKREDRVFIAESFAEDFRILLQEPTLIPSGRRQTLEELFKVGAPDVDLDELRDRIRNMYGNLYGKSVADVRRPVDCEAVNHMAEVLDRLKK